MDVNSINNNITSLNNIPQHHVDKSNGPVEIENKDEFLKLSISDYNKKRDELSASLQAFNEGIGISRTAQNGLQKQEEFLQKAEDILTKLKDDQIVSDDKNELKNSINQELLNFREEAFQTKYKNENLLAIDDYEEKLSIDISTKEAYFSIDKPNTPDIVSQVAQIISSNDFNNPQGIENALNSIQNAQEQIQSIQSQFTNLEKNLESSARESIKDQIDLTKQNSASNEINFGKEANDFSKTNIQANVGYLAASQANIVQEQSVRLLS